MTTTDFDILSPITQPMEVLPTPRPAIDPPFSQWTHYNPILVEALAAHGDVPEREVVDHLSSLFADVYQNRVPGVLPLERPEWVLQSYLDEFVAVG
jgi:hypothetical protein